MFRIRKDLWWTAIGLALLAGFLAPATLASDSMMVVKVDEAFQINGETYQAGEITLRRFAEYSPVASLHEVRVDGQSLGYIMARSNSDEVCDSNHVVFKRNAQGQLVLASLATKGEPMRHLSPFGSPAEVRSARDAAPKTDSGTLLTARK